MLFKNNFKYHQRTRNPRVVCPVGSHQCDPTNSPVSHVSNNKCNTRTFIGRVCIAIWLVIIIRSVISISHSVPSISPRLFYLYFTVKWNCDTCTLSPLLLPSLLLPFLSPNHRFFLSSSFSHASFLLSSLVHLALLLLSAPSSSSPNRSWMRLPSTLLLPILFSNSFSPSSLIPNARNPLLHSMPPQPHPSSFSSTTLPSLPHLLFSYQPGRTRIHILQAFMMAAAHLCEPACWAASSLLQPGSPLFS